MTPLHVVSLYSPVAASTRVRIYDWLRYLKQPAFGHTYIAKATSGPRTLLSHWRQTMSAEVAIRRFDPSGMSTLISREASPFSRGDVESSILARSSHGVYDLDDALFNASSRHRRLVAPPEKFERAAASADVVIAGSEYLADWLSARNSEVILVPSCVEPDDYVTAGRRASDVPTIVWLGSRSTEGYLLPLIPDLLRLHRSRSARLKVISSPQPNHDLEELSPMLDRVPWRSETFHQDLADADVAIAPLADSPFARGKCAYKVLQYGAAGLPVVGSPVGANSLALERLDGVKVSTGEDWTSAIGSVLDEGTVRSESRRANGRRAVRQFYSFSAWSDVWAGAVLV